MNYPRSIAFACIIASLFSCYHKPASPEILYPPPSDQIKQLACGRGSGSTGIIGGEFLYKVVMQDDDGNFITLQDFKVYLYYSQEIPPDDKYQLTELPIKFREDGSFLLHENLSIPWHTKPWNYFNRTWYAETNKEIVLLIRRSGCIDRKVVIDNNGALQIIVLDCFSPNQDFSTLP